MKAHIENSITIKASIESVWIVLSDFNKYPDWSPTIKQFFSIPSVGQRSKVRLEQSKGPSMTMNPLFLNITPLKELRWKGSLIVPGLFDGEHYFILEKKSDHETVLTQGEYFSGVLVYFFRKMIYGVTYNDFKSFNVALKEQVENRNIL
ncbi:SRPBCC family protein [Sphingobacterium faecium]|uniref:SRPBCC family protein n=1 Tax=Sphingobacterium faecium TaxID=34087 RepID=UPI003DA2B1D2